MGDPGRRLLRCRTPRLGDCSASVFCSWCTHHPYTVKVARVFEISRATPCLTGKARPQGRVTLQVHGRVGTRKQALGPGSFSAPQGQRARLAVSGGVEPSWE